MLKVDEAKDLLIDQESVWQKIRWSKDKFAPFRRAWGVIRDFLNIPEQQETPKAK
ncbi:MAG TPA: hypothetical protein VII20_20415 [Roseiarcus sp.]